MSRLIILMFFVICSGCAHANNIVIFDAHVNLSKDCKLLISAEGNVTEYRPPFASAGECRIVSHDGTNIPNIEFINGMYILFIESNYNTGQSCKSEYTAIALSKKLVLYTTAMIKNSNSCMQDQEIHSYEYFSVKLKPYTQEALIKMSN